MIKNTIKGLKFSWLYVGMALFVLVFFLSLIFNAKMRSTDNSNDKNKLVNIYDRGVKTSVISDGAKVKDAIEKSGIILNEHDRVEPGLDSEISNVEYNVNVYRAHPVVIVEDSLKKPVVSSYQTGNEIVKEAGINLRDEDTVELQKANELTDGAGLKAIIKRATPINLTFFGKNEVVYTQSKTVGDFLKDRNIKLGKDDKMSHLEADAITASMDLRVWREGRQTITVEEEVAYPTEKIQDADKAPGYKEIRQAGKNGKRTATYDIVVQDGVEVSRTETNSIIITQPVKQIEVHGAKFAYTGGPLSEAQITALGTCESGMTANRNSGNGFYGAFQFTKSTWRSSAPAPYNNGDPHEAPLDAQKQAVQNLLSRSSIFTQFPGCANKMRASGIL